VSVVISWIVKEWGAESGGGEGGGRREERERIEGYTSVHTCDAYGSF
jgi:hypothetical protein